MPFRSFFYIQFLLIFIVLGDKVGDLGDYNRAPL